MVGILLALASTAAAAAGVGNGAPAAGQAQALDCFSERAETRNIVGPQKGQDTLSALCALHRMGIRSVVLDTNRRALRIKTIDDLQKLQALSQVQVIFEGKVAGGFTFADGRVVHKYLNPSPYITYQFTAFTEVTTVSEVIEVAAERMRHLREVSFVEVVMPGRITLSELDRSDIEEAARSPEWRCGGEDKNGQWGYVIKIRDGRVQDIEVHGTPPA